MTDNSYDIHEEEPPEETNSEEEKKQSAEQLNKNSIDTSTKPIEEEKGQSANETINNSVDNKEDDKGQAKKKQPKDELIKQQSILGTQLYLQLFKKEDGYFYFTVKPNPGSTVIDILGNHRIDAKCKYFFVKDKQLMAHSENWSNLPRLGDTTVSYRHDPITFDQTGLVNQKKDYSDYATLQKIITETAFKDRKKHLVI